MVKYYKPEDVQADITPDFVSGTNTAYFPQWQGREIVSFGRTGAFPMYKTDDWTWNSSTSVMTLNASGDIFQPLEKFHAEFSLETDATQDFTDVVDPGTDITQYFHIIKYSTNNWATDEGEVTTVNRRCRAEFGGKGLVLMNGDNARAIVYLPLPALTIKEGEAVAVWLGEDEVITGQCKQYRKGLFNYRLWL